MGGASFNGKTRGLNHMMFGALGTPGKPDGTQGIAAQGPADQGFS
jgi:hypothetical protein